MVLYARKFAGKRKRAYNKTRKFNAFSGKRRRTYRIKKTKANRRVSANRLMFPRTKVVTFVRTEEVTVGAQNTANISAMIKLGSPQDPFQHGDATHDCQQFDQAMQFYQKGYVMSSKCSVRLLDLPLATAIIPTFWGVHSRKSRLAPTTVIDGQTMAELDQVGFLKRPALIGFYNGGVTSGYNKGHFKSVSYNAKSYNKVAGNLASDENAGYQFTATTSGSKTTLSGADDPNPQVNIYTVPAAGVTSGATTFLVRVEYKCMLFDRIDTDDFQDESA